MKRVVPNMLLAIVFLFLSQVSVANGEPPTFIHLFCSYYPETGAPTQQEGFFGNGDYCYQIEVSCDGDVSGGFLFGELNSEGHIGGHMESVAGPPGPVGPVPSCSLWFDHWQNSDFEHVCKYQDYGKLKLKAKLVPLHKCELD
jgi:hypothetical protein